MIKQEWEHYSMDNAQHTSDPILFWEAGKAHIRGRIISYMANHRKQQAKKFQEASVKLRRAQHSYTTIPTPHNRAQWQAAKTEFDITATRYELNKSSYRDLRYYRYGNKSGRMLSYLIKGNTKPPLIPPMKNELGQTTTSYAQVNEVFQKYYEKLYKAPLHNEGVGNFLGEIQLPVLTPDQTLNAQITEQDIMSTVGSLANGKVPGPDGYSSEFFKQHKETLTPTLLKV